jgi:hypothetical protein
MRGQTREQRRRFNAREPAPGELCRPLQAPQSESRHQQRILGKQIERRQRALEQRLRVFHERRD